MELALYRKYRPQGWDSVIDQDAIVSVLKSQISSGNIGHAYVFFGGRGTGKTTVARIFAKAAGVNPEDLYELDAASNRSIDDIRELREAVKTLPFSSPRKCYIIDEVHMLTKEAFNALLKTLEEPPAHVMFILATTNLEKVPETILSRCQSFSFKQPNSKTLATHVAEIVGKEGYTIDANASELVALAGNGSYRDTLSMLEKVLSLSNGVKALDVDLAARAIGAPRHEIVNRILSAIEEGDPQAALIAVRDADAERVDMSFFLRLLLAKLRAVLLLRYAPALESEIALEYSPEDVALIRTLARSSKKRVNSLALLEFLKVGELAKTAVIPTLPLEIAIIRTTASAKNVK